MNRDIIDAVKILTEGTNDSILKVQTILEDSESPVAKNYQERLLQSIIDKSHVDFGDIPKSHGNIEAYSGYDSMNEILDILMKVAEDEKSVELKEAAGTVRTAITNIRGLKAIYMKGFAKKVDLAMVEYNTYVLTCVEATTTLMYSYVDFIKTPSSPNYTLDLKNTNYRPNLLYIDQLRKFNRVCTKNNYSKYLGTLVNGGQENLLGSTALGIGAVSVVAFSVIPITRELIYLFKESKRRLSELFALQAYFLEMNKTTIEYNNTIDAKKKKEILEKQEKIRKKFLMLSSKLKVSDARAQEDAHRKLDNDNHSLTVGGIEDDISDSDISLA